MATQTNPRLFNVDEYYAMAHAGILTEDDRVELLAGEIFEKYTNGKRRLFDVDEYYAMAEAGILSEDDRVELLDGEIVRMAPIGSLHASCVSLLTRLFVTHVGERAVVRVQNPVRLSGWTEPQPDVTLVKWGDYSQGHPCPEDVLLLIEVSDTTIESDRGVKLPMYAQSGIREVWIVDLPARAVETYSEPEGDSYGKTGLVGLDGEVAPEALGDVSLSVRQILSIGTRAQ